MTMGRVTGAWALLGLCCLWLAAGCEVKVNEGDDEPQAGSGPEHENPCVQLCATAAMLACPGDEPDRCENDCNLTWDSGLCGDALHAAYACFAKQDASKWYCEPDFDEAEVMQGYCDQERAALDDCL